MSLRAPQIAVSLFGCVAVGVAWYITDMRVGAVVAASLLLLPLVNAPFELCLGFVLLSHFRFPEVFPVLRPLRLPELTALACLGALCWHLIGTRRIRPFWSAEIILFVVFFVYVTVAMVFSLDRKVSFAFWGDYFVKVAVMTVAIAWLAREPRHFAVAAQAFAIGGILVAGVALWNKVHGIDVVEGTRVTIGRELDSVLGDPNDLALMLLFPVSFALGLAVTRGVPITSRLLGLTSGILSILSILATQSRGGLLGLAAVLAFLLHQRIRSKLVLAAIAVTAALALLAIAGISERTVIAGAGGNLDASAEGRLNAWQAAIQMALARPLTGVGVDIYSEVYFMYTDAWTGQALAAHSVWFQVLGETGFIGFTIFVCLIAVTIGDLSRARRSLDHVDADPWLRATAGALSAGLGGFIVSGTFLSQAYAWPLYILIAFSAALSRTSRSSGREA